MINEIDPPELIGVGLDDRQMLDVIRLDLVGDIRQVRLHRQAACWCYLLLQAQPCCYCGAIGLKMPLEKILVFNAQWGTAGEMQKDPLCHIVAT